MNHYTNKKGYNAIRTGSPWHFVARKQRNKNPFGVYFTTYSPTEPNLALKLRVPRKKTEYVFSFVDMGDLIPLRGPRGRHIFYSPTDYFVIKRRQLFAGKA
jgi:hypothetical protein